MKEPLYRIEANDGTEAWRPLRSEVPVELPIAQAQYDDAKEFYDMMGFPTSELRIFPVKDA
jgi:hypothetical protein